jgi:hypothetical protein
MRVYRRSWREAAESAEQVPTRLDRIDELYALPFADDAAGTPSMRRQLCAARLGRADQCLLPHLQIRLLEVHCEPRTIGQRRLT